MSQKPINNVEQIPEEQGVPQYPVSPIGYVLLTDKISTEKGIYKALSAKDNVVYKGRDAGKYPTLYFVNQTISPDGRWAFRLWANDRTLADQDTWNFDIDYLEGIITAPQYVRTYIVQRATYTPLAKFSKLTPESSEVLIKEKMDSLPEEHPLALRYVKVSRIYVALPGPWSPDQAIDPDGFVVNINKRLNSNAAIVPGETVDETGLWTVTEQEGGDAIVGTEVRKSRMIPGNAMTTTKVDEDGVASTVARRLKLSSSIVTHETLIGGVWTKIYAEDPPVFRGFALRCGDLVSWEITEARVIPGNTITEIITDEQTKISVTTNKILVPSTQAIAANAGYQSGWYVEFKPVPGSALVCLKLSSQANSTTLPDAEVWYGTRTLSLPDTLLAVTPVYDETRNGGDGEGQGAGTVYATATASLHASGDFIITRTHGFQGEAVARFTRTYSSTPPTTQVTILKIFPSSGTAMMIGKGQSTNASGSSNSEGGWSKEFSAGSTLENRVSYIGPVLTAGINSDETTTSTTESHQGNAGTIIPGPGISVSADAAASARAIINIPASTPTSLNSGDWIVKEVIPTKMRFGVWETIVVEVLIP